MGSVPTLAAGSGRHDKSKPRMRPAGICAHVPAPAAEVVDWIRREPTGQYARRAGSLYERLTGRLLDVPDTTRGNYVPAVDPTPGIDQSPASEVIGCKTAHEAIRCGNCAAGDYRWAT